MDEVLFGVFAENVGRYLESVDRMAVAAARAGQVGQPLVDEVRRLASAWRVLLDEHRPAAGGRYCAGCDPRPRVVVRRRGAAMCSVWRVANAYFVRRLPDEG